MKNNKQETPKGFYDESNRIIAEFMSHGFHDGKHRSFDELEYHTSWDWLMPVVEKIAENHTFIIPFLNTSCKFEEGVLVFDEYVDQKLYKKRKINLIEVVYDEVVGFIMKHTNYTPNE